MKMLTHNEFADTVLGIARKAGAFQPQAVYDKDGDCIEFLAKPDPFYAERVDDLVTVYYSQETNEVIGSLIKGLSKFLPDILKSFPGFCVEVKAGHVKLKHLFLARLWTTPKTQARILIKTYEKLIAVAERTDAKVDTRRVPA